MIHNVDPQLNQWDVGRSVKVSDTMATHIHFANQGDSKAVKIEIETGSAKIPDYLLQTGKTVIAYAVLDGVTLESKSFPVRNRPRPEDYVYEDDQRNYIYTLITDAETATLEANQAAQNANEAAEKALQAAKSWAMFGKVSGESIAIDDAIEQSFAGFRIFGKTTQNGTPTPDAPVELMSVGDGGAVTVATAGKNLLKNTAVSNANLNGVAFAVNGNGSVTANGTAKVDTYFVVNESAQLGNGEYYLTGCPVGGSATSYFLYISGLVQDFGNGVKSNLSGSHKIGICIKANTNVSNLTFYPMIRLVSVSDGTYEPYKGQTLTISTPNGLPGIPVASGGNYTDANGQQWVCDEIDIARGVFVQRIIKITPTTASANGTYEGQTPFGKVVAELPLVVGSNLLCTHLQLTNSAIYSSNQLVGAYVFGENEIRFRLSATNTADDVTDFIKKNVVAFLCILATPIETPLPAEEIAAYASLHTYKDLTTVSCDASAYMELEYAMDAKKYIDGIVISGGGGGAGARLGSVTLRASAWTGADSLYSQVVTIDGVTQYSKVDLLPSVEQLAIFHNKDVAFVTENEDGVVTVYAIGDKPTQDYTMQVSITEVVA